MYELKTQTYFQDHGVTVWVICDLGVHLVDNHARSFRKQQQLLQNIQTDKTETDNYEKVYPIGLDFFGYSVVLVLAVLKDLLHDDNSNRLHRECQ